MDIILYNIIIHTIYPFISGLTFEHFDFVSFVAILNNVVIKIHLLIFVSANIHRLNTFFFFFSHEYVPRVKMLGNTLTPIA